jgi:hypothetical protein
VVVTTLAAAVVLAALLAPNQIGQYTPAAFVRIPVEALVGVAVVLAVPGRARRVLVVIGGMALGLLTIVKVADIGFYAILARQFDPILDWDLLGDAINFLTSSYGRLAGVAAAVGAGLLAVAVIVVMTLSTLRLSRVLTGHRRTAAGTGAAFAAAWVVCAVLGTQIVPNAPVASRSAAGLLAYRALQSRDALNDRRTFAAQTASDAYNDAPGDQLLTALRGKDVVIAFVESYGRDAVEDPEFAPQVDAVLDAGSQRLGAAGFTSRSAFLTSPTAGGGSWLAHATFQSGLWINNQQRYRSLTSSRRLTLTGAFHRANWRTVAVEPGTERSWPEGDFYGYDQVYDSRNLGYRGPRFGFAAMPDQYTMSAFERCERGKAGRSPLLATIPLVSSHVPWTSTPELVDWGRVGDGSVFGTVPTVTGPGGVRADYRRSIEYSLNSLISYVERYGNENLVMIFLGDHQPAPGITGENASWDVPISIIARDPAVLDRITPWQWQDGLSPRPDAPVWRMDTFRDRFLGTFGTMSA